MYKRQTKDSDITAMVVVTDVYTCVGVVHVIDEVLVPSIVAAAAPSPFAEAPAGGTVTPTNPAAPSNTPNTTGTSSTTPTGPISGAGGVAGAVLVVAVAAAVAAF